MEKRLAKRIFTRFRVAFGATALESPGYALNVSSEGMFLSATKIFQPAEKLQIRVFTAGQHADLDLTGTVRWGLSVPPRLLSQVKQGMGIQLNSPSAKYLDFFSDLASQGLKRTEPRVSQRLEVRFYHREQFLKEYTENISQGGLFIATDQTFEQDAELSVELLVPDLGAPLQLKARVVYRLEGEQAKAVESPAGVGVQITEMAPPAKETLTGYVQRLMRAYS